jgi:anhydro-N-acetylmuramic acid kinase
MKISHPKSMIVAGVMSGTSADGIDVALVKISLTASAQPRLKLLAHHAVAYPKVLRQAVLAAMDAKQTSTAELARLNWRLGIAYAEAVGSAAEKYSIQPDLVGCHGQTIYHQGKSAAYAGRSLRCTWQIGEPAPIAAALGVPVVSNFRSADMALGGQGAPLVPFLDYVMFAHATRARVLQNIGGIGNLTLVPANAGADRVIAFDTGPGNMVIDQLMELLFQKKYDRDGRTAQSGHVLTGVVEKFLREPYFAAQPPKSAGREQFGKEFCRRFLQLCKKAGANAEDTVATATALTAESITMAFMRFVLPYTTGRAVDYILAGGGVRNPVLVSMLRERLEPMGCRVLRSEDVGLPSQAKEAAAFALLAWQTWHCLPANVPSATGAVRAAILGEICYG